RRYSAANDMAAQPFPPSIQLQTINACQAACQMCPYPIFRNVFPRGRMEDALFDKVIAEIAEHPEVDTFIPMLQNEPFIDPHLFDKIRRFKDLTRGRIAVELVTNGAYLTEQNIDQIRRCGLDILDISLDALSREVYNKVRIGLDYDEVLAGVERVLQADLPNTAIFVRIIRLRDNVQEVKAFLRHCRRRGVSVFVYTATNRTGALEEFDAKMRLRESDQTWKYRAARRLSRLFMGHCPVPFATTNLLHNGDVLMCVHDWARREIVGNVRDATLAEIWNGEQMRELRRLGSQRRYAESPACRDCSLWKEGWVGMARGRAP